MTSKKKTQETALALKTDDFTALSMIDGNPNGIMEALDDILGGQPLKLQHLQRGVVPTGGGVAWQVKSGKGRPSSAEEINGIIIEAKRNRAWYSVPYEESGGGTAPDCISLDMQHGIALTDKGPGGDCLKCPFSQWGSSPRGSGRGQACGERIWLFLLREDRLLPMLISAPTTSVEAIDQYRTAILDSGILQHWRVMTRLTLDPDKNADGVEYGRIVPENLGPVSPEVFEQVEIYRNTFRPVIEDAIQALVRWPDIPEGDAAVYIDPQTGIVYDVDPETGEMTPQASESGGTVVEGTVISESEEREPVGAGADDGQGGLPF